MHPTLNFRVVSVKLELGLEHESEDDNGCILCLMRYMIMGSKPFVRSSVYPANPPLSMGSKPLLNLVQASLVDQKSLSNTQGLPK